MATEIRLLGRFGVARGGLELPAATFQGRQVRVLLRLLATRRGSFVPRDVLIESLWPEGPPSDPDSSLNVLVTRARRALGDPGLILTGPGGYSFATCETCTIDAERFCNLAAGGRAMLAGGLPAAALHHLQAALDLWGGEPLAEDRYEDWAQPYRERLEQTHQETLEAAAAAALEMGAAERALAWARQSADGSPLREAGPLLVARALVADNDTAGALAALAAFRERLADEAGLDPSPALDELERRILRGVPLDGLADGPRRPAPAAQPGPGGGLPFLGRDRELAACLQAAGGPAPAIVVLAGASGSGKSRLLAEVRRVASVASLCVRAAPSERDEPWHLARAMVRQALSLRPAAVAALPGRSAQALADLVPEVADLRTVPATPLDVESRRTLLLEGGVHLLEAVAEQGALVAVDDLQWADASSLVLLARAARRLPGVGLLLAFRPEEAPPSGEVAGFLADLTATGRPVLEVALGSLSQEALAGGVADADLAACLAADTDASPMALNEVIAELVAAGAVVPGPDGRWLATGPETLARAAEAARRGQRSSIQGRVARQPAGAVELISLLALLAREAPARLLAATTGRAMPDVVQDLEHLAHSGLVRFTPAGWSTAHDLISEAVAAGLRLPEAARLHELLARSLDEDGADPAEVGRHRAGAGDRVAAAQALAQAARQRLARFAHTEAQEVAEAGLALDPRPDVRASLLEVRAAVRSRAGQLAGAREDLRAALTGLPRGADRARVMTDLAMLASGAEDLTRAAELAELAIAEADTDPAARARALSVAAIIDMNANRPDSAQRRSEEALLLFRQVGNARGIADILDARAMAAFFNGDIAHAPAAFERVARLFADSGDLLAVGTPRSTRGHALVFLDRPAEALADIAEALELARTLGHAEGEAYALWHQAEALAGLGRGQEALAAAHEALAIARRLGHREWTSACLRGVGIAHQALGQPDRAEGAFLASLAVAEDLPLFAGWAAARAVLARVDQGVTAGSDDLVRRAMDEGPGLSRYEGRWAACELAVARGDPLAPTLVAAALPAAAAGGHAVGVRHLELLAARLGMLSE